MEKPWTEKHRIESLALLARVGENAALRGDDNTHRKAMTWSILGEFKGEAGLRVALADLLDAKVINREVRRVRALAEGRLARETGGRHVVRQPGQLDEEFGTPGGAKLAASQRLGATAHTLRVTRFRRVPS